MANLLCQYEEIVLPASYNYQDLLFLQIVKNIGFSFHMFNVKKITVTQSICRRELEYPNTKWIEDNLFANAICNLVSFRCNNKCNINSSQENEIYKTILYNSNIRLKFLDLRRATINIHDINAELQSEAVLNLYEYKSFVAENHAHLILNKIFISQVINLKRLLLVIKCNKNSNGKFHYSEEKMNKIKEKLDKIIVISEK